MSIKDRLKMIMDREKLTAGAFAESIGVAQATIHTYWENATNIQVPKLSFAFTNVIAILI